MALTLVEGRGPLYFRIAVVMTDDCAKFEEDWSKRLREKAHVKVSITDAQTALSPLNID